MLKSYEATFEKGKLKWVRENPEIEDGERVIVLVETRTTSDSSMKDLHRILEEARGAWGTGKSLEDIDREIASRRASDWPDNGTGKK